MEELTIVGGGLAGSEAAWQAAQRGINVNLYEMRPAHSTGAHVTGLLGELICSNSLGSSQPDRASGLLKNELHTMNSLLLECAEAASLPAGSALAVDREKFANLITEKICSHPNIKVIREEVTSIPEGPTIIASGPLTSPTFSKAISELTGQDHLFFFDAIAPIVTMESIDLSIAFRGSRYEFDNEPESGDYLNCPLDEAQYNHFVTELIHAERIHLESFEGLPTKERQAGHKLFFEGCLPIEVMAERSAETLAFGPMRPVGLRDPRTQHRSHAVLQLRQDNLNDTLYNLVGFQTNLTFSEQKRVFRLIPGLENAEFVRYGQMHRNTFIYSPALLSETLQLRSRPSLFFAGQITGVEGYLGNVATGLIAGINAANFLYWKPLLTLPRETMTGALIYYITHASPADFQPVKANYGILPPFPNPSKSRKERNLRFAKQAKEALRTIDLD